MLSWSPNRAHQPGVSNLPTLQTRGAVGAQVQRARDGRTTGEALEKQGTKQVARCSRGGPSGDFCVFICGLRAAYDLVFTNPPEDKKEG